MSFYVKFFGLFGDGAAADGCGRGVVWCKGLTAKL